MTSKEHRHISSTQNDQENRWVCVGVLGGAHGVKGDIKLKSFTEDPRTIGRYETLFMEPDYAPIKLSLKSKTKDGFIASFAQAITREEAGRLKGRKLYIRRADLPSLGEEEYYITDLQGLMVRNLLGELIGRVKGVHNFGASDVLEVGLDNPVKDFGRSIYTPFVKKYVPDVKIADGYVTVDVDTWVDDQSE